MRISKPAANETSSRQPRRTEGVAGSAATPVAAAADRDTTSAGTADRPAVQRLLLESVRTEEGHRAELRRCRPMNGSRPRTAPSSLTSISGSHRPGRSAITRRAPSCSIGWSSERLCSVGHASGFTSSTTILASPGRPAEIGRAFRPDCRSGSGQSRLGHEPGCVTSRTQQSGLASAS